MKINNVNLAFGKRSKPNAGEKNPNVFFRTTLGIAAGAISGQLIRNYLPVSDEFFCGASNKNSEITLSAKTVANQFVQNYSQEYIQDARVLKSALVATDVKKILPKLQNQGLADLINEPAVKIIDKNDSEELINYSQGLQSDIAKDLSIEDEKELLNKFENMGDIASDLLLKAKHGIIVKENLENYKGDIKGFSDKGGETIKSIKTKIQSNKEFSKDNQHRVFQAFNDMVQTAKLSQRPLRQWVTMPAVALGIASLGWAVKRKLDIENKKGILV